MITIKEEFLANVKTKKAVKLGGSDAILLWLNLKTYVAEGNTGGFIPEDEVPDLPLLPRKWDKAMTALLECGKTQSDGSRGPGLVEKVDHGYQLHHYEDHGTPVEVEDERRRKAREQKAARRLWLKHQAGTCPEDCPHCTPDNVRGQQSDSPPDNQPDKDTGRPPRASGRVPVRERDPHPTPPQPPPDGQTSEQPAKPKDLTGSAPPATPERASGPACPPDLWSQIPEGTRASLDELSIPRAVQEWHCRDFAIRKAHRTDIGRSLTRWISTWVSAIRTDWSNPENRAEFIRLATAKPPEDPAAAAHADQERQRATEERLAEAQRRRDERVKRFVGRAS